MRPHTLDEMSTIILIFCRDGANKIELIEKCYLNDIGYVHLSSPLQVKQDSCQEQKYSDCYNYCPFSYHFNFLRTPVLQYKCRAKQLIFQYSYIYNLIKRRGKQK